MWILRASGLLLKPAAVLLMPAQQSTQWSFAKWKLGLLFKEIRFGISLNQQIIHAYRARATGWFCHVQ